MSFTNIFDSSLIDYHEDFEQQDSEYSEYLKYKKSCWAIIPCADVKNRRNKWGVDFTYITNNKIKVSNILWYYDSVDYYNRNEPWTTKNTRSYKIWYDDLNELDIIVSTLIYGIKSRYITFGNTEIKEAYWRKRQEEIGDCYKEGDNWRIK